MFLLSITAKQKLLAIGLGILTAPQVLYTNIFFFGKGVCMDAK